MTPVYWALVALVVLVPMALWPNRAVAWFLSCGAVAIVLVAALVILGGG